MLGQYGAWGYFVDGCTVRLTCPTRLRAASRPESRSWQRVTLNSRLRAFSSSGNVIWYRDVSCDNANWCRTEDLVHIRGGQSASVQCNGVRQPGHNRATVACTLNLENLY